MSARARRWLRSLPFLIAVEAGGQGVMMAPTEILARQHFEALAPLARAAGVRLELLTGRDKGAERQMKLEDLAAGRIPILVGTHAVFQKDVEFARSAAGRRGRAAPLRRRAADGTGRQGPGRRCAGDDRHADSALAGPGYLWRHGCLGAGRKAAGPQAHQDCLDRRRPDGRGGGPSAAGGGRGATGLLGLPPGRGVRDAGLCQRRGTLQRPARRAW